MIYFKFMASWADDDGDEISYTFTVSDVCSSGAYEIAQARANWFERYYLTKGMKFKGMILVNVDAREVVE